MESMFVQRIGGGHARRSGTQSLGDGVKGADRIP
jgi:hypothetical protein